jgi:hypothetical protein
VCDILILNLSMGPVTPQDGVASSLWLDIGAPRRHKVQLGAQRRHYKIELWHYPEAG